MGVSGDLGVSPAPATVGDSLANLADSAALARFHCLAGRVSHSAKVAVATRAKASRGNRASAPRGAARARREAALRIKLEALARGKKPCGECNACCGSR